MTPKTFCCEQILIRLSRCLLVKTYLNQSKSQRLGSLNLWCLLLTCQSEVCAWGLSHLGSRSKEGSIWDKPMPLRRVRSKFYAYIQGLESRVLLRGMVLSPGIETDTYHWEGRKPFIQTPESSFAGQTCMISRFFNGGFPKWGYSQNYPILIGIFPEIKHSFLGIPPWLWKPSTSLLTIINHY